MTTTRIEPGDVLSIQLGSGIGLLSYVGERHTLGGVFWVFDGVLRSVPEDLELLLEASGWVTFLPSKAISRQPEIRRVGTLSRPVIPVPEHVLMIADLGYVDRDDGKVRAWSISGGGTRLPRTELSSEERKLPVASLPSLPVLIESIESGWRPERLMLDPLAE